MRLRAALTLLSLSILYSATISAQDWSPATPTEADDANLPQVQAFTNRMAKLHSFACKTHLRMEDQQSENIREYDASIEVNGKKFVITADNLHCYSDGSIRWNYIPRMNEVMIAPETQGESLAGMIPLEQLQNASKHFKMRYRGSRNTPQGKVHDISLYPRKIAQAKYTQIHISYDAKEYLPTQIAYHGRNGLIVTLSVSDFKTPYDGRKSYIFNPTDYPNVRILDLREE